MALVLCATGSAWADGTYTLGWGTASGDEGTYTNFTGVSGTVTNIVSFSTAKNSASSNPAYNNSSSELRLYFNTGGDGGSITLTPADGITITGFVMTTSTSPSVNYTVDNGTATSVTVNNNTYTVTGISASSSLMIQNVNTTNTQLRIKTIQITYTVAAPAYTITAQSNNTSYGTVSLSGSVITGSPNSGYRYADPAYSVSPANSATVAQNGNEFTVTPSANTTVTINFEALPAYTVTLSDDTENPLTEASAGAGVTLPSRSAIGSYTFAGWCTTNVPTETTTAPTIIPAGSYTPTGDITLYPVYTKAGGGAATPSAFSVGDTGDFAIVSAEQGGKYYALPTNPTVSNGKITAQEITVSETGGVKYVTTANASGFTWTIASATNGYTLSDGSKYIYHSNGGSSGTNLTYGTSTNYTWALTADGDYITMAGMSGSTTNNRGMLFQGTTIGGYALSNASASGYYKVMILPISAGSTTYYWSSPVAATVEQPVITVAENPFLFSTTATITCATEGASIKYSYNNSTWNDYSSALTITETKTIYAKAIKDENESTVASVEVTKNLATPTVTVSGDLTLDLDGETNVSAGTLSAAVTYNDSPVGSATVTWSSSDTDIATIDASGAVTIKTTGSVTFTATYAGNSDYAETTGTKTVTVVDSNAPGTTQQNPYTVAQALTAIQALPNNNATTEKYYVSGIVSAFYGDATGITSASSKRYYISDDGTTTTQLLVYSGKGLNNVAFSSDDDLLIGDRVIIYGAIQNYQGDTPEMASGNYIVSRITKANNDIAATGTINLSMANPGTTADVNSYVSSSSDGALSFESNNTSIVTVDANGIVTPVAAGTTTITVTQTATATYKAGSTSVTVIVAPATKSDNEILLDETSGSTVYGTPLEVVYAVEDGYDGTMTYTTTNSAIADVEIGADAITFTPKAVGTAVFTISAPETTTFNAADDVTFTLTVTAPAGGTTAYVGAATTATLAFGENAFDLPNSSSSTDGSYTNGTYSISISNASSYYYFSSAALFIGKSGATVTLPAFDKVVTQIDVVGRDGASSKVTENIFVTVNEEDVAVSTAATGSTSTNEFVINSDYRDIGTIYKLKVTNSNNAQITSIVVHFAATSITATLNGSGYATFCSVYPLDFSSATDYTAWTVSDVSGTTITFDQVTGSVKGGTGLLLKGENGKKGQITLTSTDSEITISGNQLYGTTAPTYVVGSEIDGYNYYGLSGNQFKKVNTGVVPAGKALLPISSGSGVKAFTFVFEGADGITETRQVSREEVESIFNLGGQRLSKMQRGVNIVNGKKVLVR